ncbi:hypothetical protein PoB_006752900 [Plakobranchus ocellatus]|uniref:Uncharacterized protein n=1 Tax=Plakobranchus ocellatus TaxID=259542 RepID=A0AAV4DA56_9GAST|nr:hypothetical protein PoB_006752900 [Plakobranchus ocellatus]
MWSGLFLKPAHNKVIKAFRPSIWPGTGNGARICDRGVPADIRADSLSTVRPTPLLNVTLKIDLTCHSNKNSLKQKPHPLIQISIFSHVYSTPALLTPPYLYLASLLHLSKSVSFLPMISSPENLFPTLRMEKQLFWESRSKRYKLGTRSAIAA